jgi:hypothetical protein
MYPPEGGPPTVPLPDPIVTSSTTFDLGADPAALERAAEAVRKVGGQALTARNLVDGAAGKIESDNAWDGDTANSFQTHRRRLTADLGVVGDAATRAADALVDIAGILRTGQAMLDDERDNLTGIAVTASPVRSPEPGEPAVAMLTFEPEDPAEYALVSSAIAAAQEIRGDVDEQLGVQAGRLRSVLYGWSQYDPTHSGPPSLRTVSDQWKPRGVRLLTYNVGEGYHNEPWFWPGSEEGTDPSDIPDAGRVIANSGADVVALQEMFRGDAERLLAWLNENAGGGWEMHFEHAQDKPQWDSDTNPRDPAAGDFGNVVLVRTGGDVGDPTQQPPVRIQDPVVVGGEEGRVLQNTEVPLE